jgi:hypothetical protein
MCGTLLARRDYRPPDVPAGGNVSARGVEAARVDGALATEQKSHLRGQRMPAGRSRTHTGWRVPGRFV